MPLSPILCQRREKLVAALRLAVAHGILSAWRRCERLATTPQEADLVAGIVVEGTPLIRWAMQSALHPAPISVSICAVFCHQAPIVAFGPDPRESCELGDILFAFVHSPRHGPIRRNALLFQAKASAQRPHRLRPDDAAQLRLYREWPDFEYRRASSLTGQRRSVTPRAPHAGAQYLVIDDTPPAAPTGGHLGFPRGVSGRDLHAGRMALGSRASRRGVVQSAHLRFGTPFSRPGFFDGRTGLVAGRMGLARSRVAQGVHQEELGMDARAALLRRNRL